jgi:protein SCO1/2
VTPGWRTRGSALALLGLLVAACGGSSGKGSGNVTTAPAAIVSTPDAPTTAPKAGAFIAPLLIASSRMAPEITLRDQNGKLFKLSGLRGKAVYLTFVYAHCPDVCPLMLQALAAAKKTLKDPSSMQIVAVSVDPKGDTPKAVKSFLAARLLAGKVRWLLGSRAQLRPVWSKYNILAKSVPETPAIIEHVSLIYGIDAKGRIRVGYPASPLKSAWFAHDAPLLAKPT